MATLRPAVLLAALLTLPAAVHAQGNLDKTLAAMNQSGPRFQSFQADLQWDTYSAVVRETDTETGTMFCRKTGSGTELGIHMTKPGEYILQYKNGIGDKYQPSQKQDDRFKVAGAEGFLALGCGGTGKDLAAAWNIKDLGPETLTLKDGQKVATEKLDLVAKDPKTRDTASHITIWMDLSRDIAVQQVLYEPSGDTKTSYYTHIRYNQKVDTGAYAIPTKGIHVIAH